VLAALSDPMRQRILDRLSSDGPMNASQMSAVLPISRQAIVKHLRILESGGLVEAHTNGRRVEFSVRPERTTQAARWLEQTAAAWEQRIETMRRLASERSERASGTTEQRAAPPATRTVAP
jgi:DNA-binding transcriptional ArsR family regulator